MISSDEISQSPSPLDTSLAAAWDRLALLGIPAVPGGLSGFLQALGPTLDVMRAHGAERDAAEVMVHLDYLAAKAGTDAKVLLGAGPCDAHPQIILDALANIGAVAARCAEAIAARAAEAAAAIPGDILILVEQAEQRLQGWCSREKSLAIIRAVLATRPETCVEIGVFGGRSAIPCAAALRHIGAGTLYGVESWSPAVAVEHGTNEGNDAWWSSIDFSGIKQAFYAFLAETGLTRQVRIVEAPSARAAALFDRIDLLHIDGAHSVVNAAEDVVLYAQKVRQGGIVIFDDVNWHTTAPAMAILSALCDTVEMLHDPATGKPICAVMRRR